ncbi:D-isomer specific 2-hydroxyacid dehydrogenase [Salinisphaera dokdonensis CL-ES53]|uniref:D-isomer specific 2-hydroxyacid dehydrogenase n=2 Tax=Salinisphaera TaxID=180541 RepID=A0ABV2AWR6_9GAMM
MPPNVLGQLESAFTVHVLPTQESEAETMLRDVGPRIRGLATNAVQAPPVAVLDVLPNLEVIASSGIGTDALNADYAHGRGIVVANTPDVLSEDVADAGIMLMLAVSRQLLHADRNVRDGLWLKGLSLGHRVNNKRLGIVGLGRIGRAIARRAEAFDMVIAYHQRRADHELPYRYYDDVAALAADSDFLMVVVPGGPATENMIDRRVLDALGPQGVLINVGRGSTVDEPALVAALAEGRIRGAGLDVLADEPNVPEALCTMDQVVLAPHYASGTVETRLAMGQLVVDNLRAHFRGDPLLTPVT